MEENIDILEHSGVAHDENPPGRGSGRYPWGSGDKAFQRPKDFLDRVNGLRAQGLSNKEIAYKLGFISDKTKEGMTTRLLAAESIAKNEERLDIIREVRALAKDNVGATEGAKRLGLPNESSFRSYLKEGSEFKSISARKTADDLVRILNEKGGNLLVGEGTAEVLNIPQSRLDVALELLYFDGYEVWPGRMPYPTNKEFMRTVKVLCPPGTPKSAGYDYDNFQTVADEYMSHDGVTIKKAFEYPASLDSKRLMVRYGDQGGEAKDGVVEIRRGVKDLDIGYHYAQVRILVDDTHYIKGMAVYGDDKDFPKGVDVIFNTNKKTGTPIMDKDPDAKQVLKPIGKDPSNPFNSNLKENGGQSYWTDDKGVEHLSLINRREVEGGWGQWSKELPSQFLSKQPVAIVNKQLNLAEKQRREELDEIEALTNNTIKKKLLLDYASTVDGQAVNLKAASLPGQKYQVILPLTTIKDDEVYAPNFKHGETLSLIRFPHAGRFEIAKVTVNNNNAEGDRVITKDALDAIGISANVAKKLSGADFDGDTVLVIPHRNVSISSRNALEGLKNFDIELEYGDHPGNVHMKKSQVGREMGIISNLITDMTIVGATDEELTRAVKHSMVVIDAVKHKYDYKQSEKDNRIDELKHKYQRRIDEDGNIKFGGAATIISGAKGIVYLPYKEKAGIKIIDPETGKSKGVRYIDPETGEKLFTKEIIEKSIYKDPLTGERVFKNPKTGLYQSKNPDSKPIPKELAILSDPKIKTFPTTAMANTKDAMTLVSPYRNPVEMAYANYANYLKALANEARKGTLGLKETKYDPSAAKTYAKEVDSLNTKYREMMKRRMYEQKADAIANENYKAWLWDDDNFYTTGEQRSKQMQRLMTQARQMVGLTSRMTLEITPREWEAIQAGAIGSSKLAKILQRADLDVIKSYATPHKSKALTTAQINRIKNLKASGKSNADIAEVLGINTSTVIKYLEGGN